MSVYKVTDTELTNVANAIRQKGGTQALLEWPNGFISAVGDISSGGSGTKAYVISGTDHGSAEFPADFTWDKIRTLIATGKMIAVAYLSQYCQPYEVDYDSGNVTVFDGDTDQLEHSGKAYFEIRNNNLHTITQNNEQVDFTPNASTISLSDWRQPFATDDISISYSYFDGESIVYDDGMGISYTGNIKIEWSIWLYDLGQVQVQQEVE